MFIGHYAAAFAGKYFDRRPSLGTMFLAVQWLDLIWPVFVLAGIEKFSIDAGNTVLTPLDFVYYPWSHSMLMAIGWASLFGIVYFIKTRNNKGAILLFVLVFSHWILDWITHRPDLQFTPFSESRTGLGLWNHKWLEIIIETSFFILAVFLYATLRRTEKKHGNLSLFIFAGFLLLIHFMNIFGPAPTDIRMVNWSAFAQWILVAWGYWIDRKKE